MSLLMSVSLQSKYLPTRLYMIGCVVTHTQTQAHTHTHTQYIHIIHII